MLHLDWIWERRNRLPVLLVSGVFVLAIAAVDWWTKPYFSLGFLYLFPIMLAAGFLPRWSIALLGLLCALLSERFSNLDPADAHIRLGFETLALCGCGLLMFEVLRNKRLSLEAQQRIRVLVETSPAAIVTVDERGFIELANEAASQLMSPHNGSLVGQPIAAYLPELHRALRPEEGPQFRSSMQCRGHRGNGESFLAEVWFSSYKEGTRPKLAAIIADVTEEQSLANEGRAILRSEGTTCADQSRDGSHAAGGAGPVEQGDRFAHGYLRKCRKEYAPATVWKN